MNWVGIIFLKVSKTIKIIFKNWDFLHPIERKTIKIKDIRIIRDLVLTIRWNELGIYDIPAMIDHVQMVTGRQKVIHIGHSMGTTSFYTMLAKKPHYNEKVYAHLSLAPVAFTSRMRCLEVVRPLTLVIKQLVVSIFLLKNLKILEPIVLSKRLSLLSHYS